MKKFFLIFMVALIVTFIGPGLSLAGFGLSDCESFTGGSKLIILADGNGNCGNGDNSGNGPGDGTGTGDCDGSNGTGTCS